MPDPLPNSPLVYSLGELAVALRQTDAQLRRKLARLYGAGFPRPIPALRPAVWSRAQVAAWIDASEGGDHDPI